MENMEADEKVYSAEDFIEELVRQINVVKEIDTMFDDE
jgi:hypothetical protein